MDGIWKKSSKTVSFPLEDFKLLFFFDGPTLKLNRRCFFTRKEFVANPEYEDLGYSAIAIVNHFGGLRGGHYNCFVQHNGKWFCQDDSHSTEADPDHVISNASYILFYIRNDL